MWKSENYWRECEHRGFHRTSTPGKIRYEFPKDKATGHFELWGDPSRAVVCFTDFTLRQPWHVLEQTDECFLQLDQSYDPQLRPDGMTQLCPCAKLQAQANYPARTAYKKFAVGYRHCGITLTLRQKFFEELPFALPLDFWDTSAKVFSAGPVEIPGLPELLDQFRSCPLTGSALSLMIQGKAYEALALILPYVEAHRSGCQMRLSDTERQLLESVKDILAQHLEDPPSIQELASVTGLNQQKLMTGFRYLNNITIYGYLKKIRMRRAADLLKDTDLPVLEVAKQVGYHGDGHFQSAFREVYGITPHKLRNQMRCSF